MDDCQKKVEHLKLVQGVVNRMASNSAQMKTWAVSLVTAAVVFSGLSDQSNWLICVGVCIPAIAFWWLDAKYLHLERCYIKLYGAVVDGLEIAAFDLNYRPHVKNVDSVGKIFLSWSTCGFYVALLVVLAALAVILVTTRACV